MRGLSTRDWVDEIVLEDQYNNMKHHYLTWFLQVLIRHSWLNLWSRLELRIVPIRRVPWDSEVSVLITICHLAGTAAVYSWSLWYVVPVLHSHPEWTRYEIQSIKITMPPEPVLLLSRESRECLITIISLTNRAYTKNKKAPRLRLRLRVASRRFVLAIQRPDQNRTEHHGQARE
jgi:hypothetical protein